MKYYKQIGLLASAALFICCFLPWAYYADIDKHFTGFFSYENRYGKPGIFFSFVAIASVVLILLNKIWAKRTHIFIAALALGYLIRTYILFTSCYNAYCPEKRFGIYLLLLSCVLLLVVAIFPDMDVEQSNTAE